MSNIFTQVSNQNYKLIQSNIDFAWKTQVFHIYNEILDIINKNIPYKIKYHCTYITGTDDFIW